MTLNYTADGELIQKTTWNPVDNTGYWLQYVNGIEYKNWVLDRLPHPEGSVIRKDDGTYEYEYNLKDHLGSNRVVFRDKDNDRIIDTSDIKQINHTYPFGMDMEGNWNGSFMGTGTQGNAYKYNGKEFNNDFGLNWNHQDWRFYDGAVNRWWVLDPESETDEQIGLSPYHFSYNNPIRFSDPDGREPVDGPGDPPTYWEKVIGFWLDKLAEYGSVTSGRENDNFNNYSDNVVTGAENIVNDFLFLQATFDMTSVQGNSRSTNIAKEESAVSREAISAKNVVNLERRAKEIHDVQNSAVARNKSTTAVADVINPDGSKTRLVASSRNTLTPAQRNALKNGEQAVKGKGHAEVTILNHASKNGQTVKQIAASRPVCQSCKTAIDKTKAKVVSPVKSNSKKVKQK